MLNAIMVVIAFALICFYEVPGLIQSESWRDLAAFSVISLIALIPSLLLALGVKLPLLIPMIYKAFSPLLSRLGLA